MKAGVKPLKRSHTLENGSKKCLRAIAAAAMTALTISTVQADELAPVPEIMAPVPKTINIPQPVPTHGKNAGYILSQELTAPTDTSITLYEVINNEVKPHYYEYTIKEGAIVGSFDEIKNRGDVNLSNLSRDFIKNTDDAIHIYISSEYSPEPIIGDFINNETGIYTAYGPNSIQGNFIGNSGTAIKSHTAIDSIKGNFFDNKNGAIYHTHSGYDAGDMPKTIKIEDSVFINNSNIGVDNDNLELYKTSNKYAQELIQTLEVEGGAVTNKSIADISNSFFAQNHTTNGHGGAINTTVANDQLGTTYGLYTITKPYEGHEFQRIKLNLTDNSGNNIISGYTVAVKKDGNIVDLAPIRDIDNFYLSLYYSGGAELNPEIGTATYTLSELGYDGELTEDGIEDLKILFANNNLNDINDFFKYPEKMMSTMHIDNTSFIGNYAESTDEAFEAKGGAIYSAGDITIKAHGGYDAVFKDNYTLNNSVKDYNAIYVARNGYYEAVTDENGELTDYKAVFAPATLRLDAKDDGRIFMYDKISGDNGSLSASNTQQDAEPGVIEDFQYEYDETPHYNVKFTGDETGYIYLLNDVENSPNVSLDDTNLYLGRESVLNNSRFSLNSGNLQLANNQIGTMELNSFHLGGTANVSVDADLANAQMDRITADEYTAAKNASLNVNYINLLSDAKQDETKIQFAEDGLKDYVNYTGVSPISYTPIWKYNVNYNKDDGYFTFSRGGSTGGESGNPSVTPPVEAFNPAVLSTPAAAQTGAAATMGQVFNYAFQHSDNYLNIPYLERIAAKNANKYALSPTGNATDTGNFSPLFTHNEKDSIWVKPYASFENIPLKNGPKVSNITYGTLIGYDSKFQHLKHGWDRIWTGYIGYTGTSQRYSGVDSTQNGGLIGGTMTMYKGNFFNATTLSTGAIVGNNRTMYGNEDFTMLIAGIANKTGYNFEFKEGKFIIQPSMLMSYTFVNTFDYTNAAGVRINSEPLHALQFAPGVKFIGNIKGGWQPYASVNMVWNLLDKSDVTANNVKLPEMSIKPYVQYGVGIQKRFNNDNMMIFGQAMIQNGGRNGISLSGGFRWTLGKEGKPVEKVEKDSSRTERIGIVK